MTRIVVSPQARADFRDMMAYLESRAGQAVALKYAERFAGLYDQLTAFPDTGASRPKLGANIRIRTIRPFVVIYRHAGDLIEIVRIVRGSRHISRKTLRGNRRPFTSRRPLPLSSVSS